MSWLRIDDAFTTHPKFEGWPFSAKWAFLELMSYCARYRTRGRIPKDMTLLPRSTTIGLLTRAETSGWIDRAEDGSLWIHDFHKYNPSDPTAAERNARSRNKRRNAERNAGRNSDRNEDVTDTAPRARARAGPVPSLTAKTPRPRALPVAREAESGLGRGRGEIENIEAALAEGLRDAEGRLE